MVSLTCLEVSVGCWLGWLPFVKVLEFQESNRGSVRASCGPALKAHALSPLPHSTGQSQSQGQSRQKGVQTQILSWDERRSQRACILGQVESVAIKPQIYHTILSGHKLIITFPHGKYTHSYHNNGKSFIAGIVLGWKSTSLSFPSGPDTKELSLWSSLAFMIQSSVNENYNAFNLSYSNI